MPMVVAEFSMFPLDKGESVSPYVARIAEIIEASGLDYHMHAMGTVLEGDYDQVMGVVGRCFQALAVDCRRILCNLHLDYRQGQQGRLHAKVASVEDKIGHKLL
jgi:uncharacterized protein (TIGR00106 family)